MTTDFSRHAQSLIRVVPDWPDQGVIFRDITPLLAHPEGLRATVDAMHAAIEHLGEIDIAIGVEARGFILAPPLAMRVGAGFVPVRKAGKLPPETMTESYALEYGEATIEIHTESLVEGARVLIVDDVLATGGTLKAASALVRSLGAHVVAHLVLIELPGLGGRDRLGDEPVISLLEY